MHAEKLDQIIKTGRGMVYLRKRLLEIDSSLGHMEATRMLNKIWKSTVLTDAEKYQQLSALLCVDAVSISREQFVTMINKAIDHAEDYFMDPLEAVHMLCENIEKNGGLAGIARRLDLFTKKI